MMLRNLAFDENLTQIFIKSQKIDPKLHVFKRKSTVQNGTSIQKNVNH